MPRDAFGEKMDVGGVLIPFPKEKVVPSNLLVYNIAILFS